MPVPPDGTTLERPGNLQIKDIPSNDAGSERDESGVKLRASLEAVEKPQNETDAESVAEAEESSTESSDDPVTDVDRDDAESETSSRRTARPGKKFITLIRDDDDEEFMLPWAECKTWEGMENFIKLAYKDYLKAAKKEIEEGQYKVRADGQAIFTCHWEDLAIPGWTVRVQRISQLREREDSTHEIDETSDEDEDDSNNKGKLEGKYDVKARYTIDYYRKDRYNDDEYLNSKADDKPIMLSKPRNRGQTLPVLEEKTTVLFPRRNRTNNHQQPDSGHPPDLDARGYIKEKHVHIHSPFLMNALRAVMKYSSEAPSGDENDTLKAGKFSYPYRDLFHHRQELSDYKKQTTGTRENHAQAYNAECDQHIDLLLHYLENEPTVQVKEVEARWAKKVPTTTFAGFWLLMKPGSDVYVREDGQLNAYVVDAVSGGVEHFYRGPWSTSIKSYDVRLWNLVYDGKVIKRRSKNIEVPVFDSERNITTLPLFPIRFQDQVDGGLRCKQLIERGQKVFRFSKGPAFLEYTGTGLRPGWKKYNRARVVVEHESQPWERSEFRSTSRWDLDDDDDEVEIRERVKTPHCECSSCTEVDARKELYISGTFSDYDNIDPKSSQTLSEHQCLVCMSHMFGFILKDRMYDLLDVGSLTDPRIAEDAIDRLVMRPAANKDTIKAIVQTYTDSHSQAELFSADFIHGKGEGQIFLLHGPPGTGKTLTAESVAEYTKRPLLSITAADLGHEPIELERNLLRFFKDANSWDAVVLLDEADIYLERRSANDLRRNSIVSIFLRALDYFQGILFLTTNRVGHFDEAFMSRIHIAIGYESLDEEARGQIWNNLFRKLKDDHKHGGPEIRYEYDAKEYVKRSKEINTLEWNGREIRNAFQSAVALAIYDSKTARERGASEEDAIPEVKEKHLKQIADMSTAFKSYMVSTHDGIKDGDMAYKLGIRDDKFSVSQMSSR
ncbi:hypothetical protein F4820DRAFT_470922 [Hypoxylon rubiginosum]|uniref:Uncharacterized protein n=1 Tax=Hypoxylon rubiginosum TaxID=110542 RepID=A0ACB9YXA1_9PEZI|nr:hypothetical protein F4820DRAFT_470922 [Hypoxylon rubiginosum]